MMYALCLSFAYQAFICVKIVQKVISRRIYLLTYKLGDAALWYIYLTCSRSWDQSLALEKTKTQTTKKSFDLHSLILLLLSHIKRKLNMEKTNYIQNSRFD